MLHNGRRQIVQLLLPGDVCGLPALSPAPSRCATVAISKAQIADFGTLAEVLQSRDEERSELLAMVGNAVRRDQRAMLDHLLRLGGLSAVERTAHLLVDLYSRTRRLGLTRGMMMPLPLTQEVLADHLGLSIVHVNRVMRQLCREGLIAYRNGRVTFTDLGKLATICGLQLPDPAKKEESALSA